MSEQAAQLEFAHTSQFTTPVAEAYAEELLAFAGPSFEGGAVFFTSGGSEAIETALKLARQYQVEIGHAERFQVISRRQSYHGATLGALSVSGNRRRREIYLPMVEEFAHVAAPYCYRCAFDCTDGCYHCGQQYASQLERAMQESNGRVAAFIFEPVSGATLGAVLPPAGYLQSVAEVCHKHGVLLIADEVMTGMGRTGRNFAAEHWQVAPDLLVAAKGLSSGYAPLGAVIASRKVVEAIADGSGTLLRYLQTHSLVRAADDQSEGTPARVLRTALDSLLELPAVGDVRGIGLLLGVEFVADKKTKHPFPPENNFAGLVGQRAAQRGVLVYPMQGCVDGIAGDHLLVAPPAILTAEQIHWSVAQLRQAIEEAPAR